MTEASGPVTAANQGETPGQWADEIIRSLAPRRVFDAGCGAGDMVAAFWDRGIEARGRDSSADILTRARLDMRPYCEAGSIAAPIPQGQDLVLCIEVSQYMPEAEALNAIAAMTAAAPRVLFASSPRDFDAPGAVNVRPVIYWLRMFGEAGFSPVPQYDAVSCRPTRPDRGDNSSITLRYVVRMIFHSPSRLT